MIYSTTRFGEIEIAEKDIIILEDGLLGFRSQKRFVVLDLEDVEDIKILHSLDHPDVAFPVLNPLGIYDNYNPIIEERIVKKLEIEKEEDVIVLCTVSIKEDFKDSTINLKGPIIVNISNKKGKQIILEDDMYSTKQPLLKKGGD